MGIHSNTAIFGNVGIIAIGDFYQCSPVASSSIYSSLLWSDHFEYVELKINERQKTNVSFSQMLNRIRKIKKKEDMSKEDRDVLEKCHQRYLNKEYHPEALHLFAKNAQVDAHNEEMIEKICTNIRTFYEVDSNDKEIKQGDSKHSRKNNKPLRLAKNARVMITKNISVNDGLANGVTGRIIDFVNNNNTEISRIIITCDSTTVGRLHRISCPHCHGKDTICVTRESDTIDQQDSDFRSRKSIKQFPLRLSWAMTVHKAQGITVDQVVISTKDFFGTGMGYTALSRVRTVEGLFIVDVHVNKFYCNENIDRVLSQMKAMRLKCNFNAFRQHHLTRKADIICLAETWLKHNNDINKLKLDGYNFLQKTRLTSFESSHPLHSRKGGGVAIYFREDIYYILKTNSLKELSNLFTVTEQLASIGFQIVNILGDGNCFFRAISHQLYRHEHDHLNIRSATINYLIENMNNFAPFVDDMDSTIENYIERMSRNGTYADHLAISATAVILNKNIIIHEIGKTPLLIPGSDFIDHQVHVCYYPDLLHYDSIVCVNNESAFLSAEQILFTS
ncbi:unnamed protein product [Rotaria sp. Silwood1]|nr:unnamed protein product [Rotaria sp. Silwood1]CAF1674550.1 unnamed protein product [Rotaria sp. Silwood1]